VVKLCEVIAGGDFGADVAGRGEARLEMPRLSPSALDAILDDLFHQDPPPQVMAMNKMGIFVPMPQVMPVRGAKMIHGTTSALLLVAEDDVVSVVEARDLARRIGAVQVTAHPVAALDAEVLLHFIDARHRYGVHLAFAAGASEQSSAAVAIRPRYGVMRKDAFAVMSACDEASCRMLGRPERDLLGRRSLELLHPDDHQRAIASWMDMLAHPGVSHRVRLRHERSDGTWMWLEVTNHNLLNDSDHGYVLAELIDITDEMAATEALRANEELLRRMTEALPVGVVQLDGEGRVVYRNDSAEAILGRPLPVGQTCGENSGNPALAEAIADVLCRGTDVDLETVHEGLPGAGKAGGGGSEAVRRIHVSLRVMSLRSGRATGAIACLNDVTEAAELREELVHQATHDQLTGCLNRRATLQRLEDLLATGRTLTVLFVDLDGFKDVNDRYGHGTGDALLRHLGAELLRHCGPDAVVGRLGGDEFLIATTELADDDAARKAAEALEQAIMEPVLLTGVRLSVRASIGIARSTPEMGGDALVAAADTAMYRAKTGRSTRTGGA
jgi:diguanylate cyclase (GGDEF)-like protein/PAS domain S-box-containing protein